DNRLTSRQFGGPGQTPLRFDYAYDADSRVTTETRFSDLAGTTTVGYSQSTYDGAGRLTNLQHKDGSNGTLANYTYTYDVADRLTGKQENGTLYTYSYDSTDQLTGDNGAAYSYDANGNRTNAGYVTGAGNRTTSDGTWTYTYDDAGDLVKKSK